MLNKSLVHGSVISVLPGDYEPRLKLMPLEKLNITKLAEQNYMIVIFFRIILIDVHICQLCLRVFLFIVILHCISIWLMESFFL